MVSKIYSFLDHDYERGTLHFAMQKFLSSLEGNVSDASLIHLYRSLIALGDSMGNINVNDVDRRRLEQYVEGLRGRYAAGTLRSVVGDIRQFFGWCASNGHIDRDVSSRLKRPKALPRDKSANDDDVQAVIAMLANRLSRNVVRDVFGNLILIDSGYCSRLLLRDLFGVVFLYETGCRAGELANLSSNAMNNAIPIGGAYAVQSYGKTGDVTLMFTSESARLWSAWSAVNDSDWAFPSMPLGKPVKKAVTRTISQMLVRRCKDAGVTVFRPHALRHAKIARLRRSYDIAVASRTIGHGSLASTYYYAGVGEQEVAEAVKATGLQCRTL